MMMMMTMVSPSAREAGSARDRRHSYFHVTTNPSAFHSHSTSEYDLKYFFWLRNVYIGMRLGDIYHEVTRHYTNVITPV